MIYTVKLKTLAITFTMVIIAVFSAVAVTYHAKTVSTDNWGLSFNDDNMPPVANETAEKLKEYDAFYIGDTSEKKVYLTFDAGYENGNTPAILDALKKHNVKAAFFIVGNYINTQPELVKRMNDEGHIVANHTNHHPDMSAISDEAAFKEELESLEKLYKETTGCKMKKLYRPPQGKYNKQNLEMAKKLGYRTYFWSLAYVDWYEDKQPTREDAMKKLTSRIHPGAVILLHSTSKTNAEILDDVLTKWKEMGYTFDSIENLK